MIMMSLALRLSFVVAAMVASSQGAMQVVDLTYEVGNDTLFWPGSPSFQFDILVRGLQSRGYWYESNSFSTAEHGGTHVDAPAHFYEGSWRTEDIPASRLVGPGVVLDVKQKAAADSDHRLTVEDVEAWEEVHGKLPEKCVLMMNSGWASRYPNASQVFNTPTPTNVSTFHFPGIHPDTATFLATQRDVIAVGVDTPSVDYGQSTLFETHVTFGRYNIIGLENVANLEDLPAKGFTVVIGLVKLHDGSGGPARILGLVDNDNGTGNSNRFVVSHVLILFMVISSFCFCLKL